MGGVKLLCCDIWPLPLVNVGLRDKGLAATSLPALSSLVTLPTVTLVIPKWIFPAIMLPFRLVDPTPPCLASLLGQASLKSISKLICQEQKFWFPALITKWYIDVYYHHLFWVHGTTIYSFAQAKNLHHPWFICLTCHQVSKYWFLIWENISNPSITLIPLTPS